MKYLYKILGAISATHPEKAQGILDNLKPIPFSFSTLNRRIRSITDNYKSSDPEMLAQALGELATLAQDKEVSYGEQKMIDVARKNLANARAESLNRDPKDIEREISSKLFPKGGAK